MNYTELLTDIAERVEIDSEEGLERIGRRISSHNRRISATCGMSPTRQEQVNELTTDDSNEVTFAGVEKMLSVWTSERSKPLREISLAELRAKGTLTNGMPSAWAYLEQKSTHVIIALDALSDGEYTVYADAITNLPDLSGTDEPALAQSFHDCLLEAVLTDEYRKKGDLKQAAAARVLAQDYLDDLRYYMATAAWRNRAQRASMSQPGSGMAGGGTSSQNGSLSWTQSGEISFERAPLAPFAVEAGSAVVPNLDADLLDGEEGSYYLNASNLNAGTIPDARFPSTLPSISGANLTNLDANDLASGTVPDARFPSTLPAVSGANLTNLDANDLASGTIPTGRFPTWTVPGYSAGNFTASGSMTWTVDSGDVTRYAYLLLGKTMVVQFTIANSVVGGTPSSALRIALPGGATAQAQTETPVTLVDNSANTTGYAQILAGGTYISIARTDNANFTSGTVWVFGQITIEVQ